MHRVFVYGTLKRGLQNHGLLVRSAYLGPAQTVGRYRMLDGRFPVLRDDAGPNGHVVAGELYDVDDATLAKLDELEGVAKGIYERVSIDIVALNDKGSPADSDRAFIYIGCGPYWDRQARTAFAALNARGHLDWMPSKGGQASRDDGAKADRK